MEESAMRLLHQSLGFKNCNCGPYSHMMFDLEDPTINQSNLVESTMIAVENYGERIQIIAVTAKDKEYSESICKKMGIGLIQKTNNITEDLKRLYLP